MENGLTHLAGTGSRVSLERVRERPFPMTEPAPRHTCKAIGCEDKNRRTTYGVLPTSGSRRASERYTTMGNPNPSGI